MAKYKEGYVQIGFKIHRNLAKQFEDSIEEWNKESGLNLSKTDVLQVLVLRFIISREEAKANGAKAEAPVTDNKNVN